MKGVVFTEFLDFVAERYGDDTVDDIVEHSAVPSGGAYTAVGTYPHSEMLDLCGALAEHTGRPAAELVKGFGHHLSGSFAQGHPGFFSRAASFFDFLESIEGHIHVEVRKLYPDAELPSFTTLSRSDTRLQMRYHSPRRMGALAEGLIEGTALKFGVRATVQQALMPGSDGQTVHFTVDLN